MKRTRMPSERHCVEHLLTLAKATRTRKLQLQETIALGLLVAVKWDKAKLGKPRGHIPTAQELANSDQFTESELSNLRETAQGILDQHAARSTTWWQWWSGVSQAFVGALLWSLTIFIIGGFAIYFRGGDIGLIIRDLTTTTSEHTNAGH